jgi:geranylgeranyl diphosphate synthase type I
MRTELAVGQFADLVNDAGALPTLDEVLDVSRRKSGNYTVRRPLEIGAALAGCGEAVLRSLSDYGEAVGEAFQLRDDLLGVYGSPAITGKPIGGDLRDGNATSVVVAAYHLARGSVRRDLAELMSLRELAETDIAQWQRLIIASGALALVEQMIDERLARALSVIADARLSDPVGAALAYMAGACAERAA